jgi:hypothetical protein
MKLLLILLTVMAYLQGSLQSLQQDQILGSLNTPFLCKQHRQLVQESLKIKIFKIKKIPMAFVNLYLSFPKLVFFESMILQPPKK